MKKFSILQGNQELMTTKELAMVLGVSPETIRLNGKEMFPELFVNGKTTLFNEAQCTAIKMKIEKHHNLQSTLEVLPKTKLEKQLLIKQAMMFQEELIAELQAENEKQKQMLIEQAPKAEFYDKVTGSPDTIDMKGVAKVLNFKNIGRNNLFEILRKQQVLDKRNQPYQQYVDAGYFRIIETRFEDKDGDVHINLKTVVFQKGVDFIRKLVLKELNGESK